MSAQTFQQWAGAALPAERADGARRLAHDFLYGSLAEAEREHARLILTGLLDDPSTLVRRALAEQFAGAVHVPHYMVFILAGDDPEIAAIVLARSPLLSDAELVDFAATAGAFGQSAIALRPAVSAPLAAALAEVGACEALIALAENPGAELMDFSIRRMIERHGQDAGLRAALLARPELPAPLRSEIASAAVKTLAALLVREARIAPDKARRLTREACERANIQIAAESAGEIQDILNFIVYLRSSGQLTAGLLLRGVLCGNKHLLEAALSVLTGTPLARVARAVAIGNSAHFSALYRKARMPERLLPAFAAGLQAAANFRICGTMDARLKRPLITCVLQACESTALAGQDPLIARLRSLEAEAARDEARDYRRAVSPPGPPAVRGVDMRGVETRGQRRSEAILAAAA